MTRRASWFAWIWFIIGALYLIVPLFGTFVFSLQKVRGTYSVAAYEAAFSDTAFWETFTFSCLIATMTIVASLALVVPTAYWVNLRMPRWRPVVEFITLLPFVIPAIVLVFGMIKTYGKPLTIAGIEVLPSLLNTGFSTNIVLIAAYTVLSLPYMYRATDNGLRAMDVRTLTEAAQSLGASWLIVLMPRHYPEPAHRPVERRPVDLCHCHWRIHYCIVPSPSHVWALSTIACTQSRLRTGCAHDRQLCADLAGHGRHRLGDARSTD